MAMAAAEIETLIKAALPDAEVTITTEGETPEESAEKVMAYLREVGILPR